MAGWTLVTPPAVEPVTLAEVKAQIRVDSSADDALITGIILAARQWAERYTGRAFVTQTWRLWLDGPLHKENSLPPLFSRDEIVLPKPPLLTVNSVQTFDNSDASTVWAAANYFVDTTREPGRLALRSGAVWPAPQRLTNGLMVEFNAGYGADGSAVPEAIKLAIRQLVAHWYEHRGEAGDNATLTPLVITALLDPFRVRRLGASCG